MDHASSDEHPDYPVVAPRMEPSSTAAAAMRAELEFARELEWETLCAEIAALRPRGRTTFVWITPG